MRRMIALAAVLLGFAAGSACGATNDAVEPLAWSQVTAVLANQPATGPERDLALDGIVGRTASLPMEFVREEQDSDGNPRFLYRHAEGSFLFSCYVKGGAANKGSGIVTGRIARLRYTHVDLHGTRGYFLWMEADTFVPFQEHG